MKGVLWKLAKRLSYIEDARCLKVNLAGRPIPVKVLIWTRVRMENFLSPDFKGYWCQGYFPCTPQYFTSCPSTL